MSNIKYVARALLIDNINRLKFGQSAPRFGERIWVRPEDLRHYIESADFYKRLGRPVRRCSGRVISEWPLDLQRNISDNPKINYCFARWSQGMSWSDAGAIDFMLDKIAISPTGVSDGCRNYTDVIERFDALDRIWAELSVAGRLPCRKELIPTNFRELGGVLIHLGPGGEPIFSGAGCHRFAMALLLGAPFPAQLGCVHESALDKLLEFRSRPGMGLIV